MNGKVIERMGALLVFSIFLVMSTYTIVFSAIPLVFNKTNSLSRIFTNFNDENVNYVDYEKLYPFEKNDKIIKRNNKGMLQKYKDFVYEKEDIVEKLTSKKLYRYEKFVELSYYYDKVIHFDLTSNSDSSVIKLGNNYFSNIYSYKDTKVITNKILDFSTYLSSKNIDFLYVQALYKISDDFNLSPIYNNSTDKMMDNFLNSLNDKVNYLDLREYIKKDNLNNLQMFFETDHHWLPQTGLWATDIISEYLNDNLSLNLSIDNLDKNKFNYKTYNKIFLGSLGRNVSLANAKPENFTLITPKFETKLHVNLKDLNLNKIGSYEETLVDWSKVDKVDYYNISPYAAYAYGDKALIEIENKMIHNNKKILFIKDSFGEVVSPFLALENEFLSIIDLRFFNGSLKTYINSYKPDVVIVMYNGDMLRSPDYELWNFE